MHQYRGKLMVHTGSMFSGKTSSLEKDMKRFKIAGYKTVVFKPSTDNRVNTAHISTHDNTFMECIVIDHFTEIEDYLKEHSVDVVGVDEIQFFKDDLSDILDLIDRLLEGGKTVVTAGLDMDYEAQPFEIVKELLPRADYLEKHHAVCSHCGTDAWVSHRTSKDTERVVIGATETYEPVCRNCYLEIKNKEKE